MKQTKKKNIFLSFGIGKETFAVSVLKVLEVLDKQYITNVPNVPEYVEGVINFRGKITPVIDFRMKFSLPRRKQDEKFVVIVFDVQTTNKRMLIGAMADKVNDVIAFNSDEVLEVPELGAGYKADFILGMLKAESSFTMVLDIDKIFTEEDVEILSKTDTIFEEQLT